MHTNDGYPCLEVETDDTIYEIELGPLQIEITGKCNMACEHCRAGEMPKIDMPIEQIIKIMQFARKFSPNYKEITLSGGEPLMHSSFRQVLSEVQKHGGNSVTITTNGSLVTSEILQFMQSLKFERLMISVSVDALDAVNHDSFRKFNGAFDSAVNALKLVSSLADEKIVPSMKSVIKPDKIVDMEGFVKLAMALGCKRLSFTSVIASGLASQRNDLWMSPIQKKQFLCEVYRLKPLYPDINITTNDPLKCLIRGYSDLPQDNDELVYDGCPAGTVTFNVNPDGVMTPCPLLNVPMMNITEMSIDEITVAYQQSEIVKNMLEMNLNGKCGTCSKKYQCGGCRARAFSQNRNIMDPDPECWL